MSKSEIKIAVIGATGSVGRIVISKLLNELKISPKNLRLYASENSSGKNMSIDGNDFLVEDANKTDFHGLRICIFNTEAEISEKLVPAALKSGAYVVDSSSHFRLNRDVPLIVPPVNINEVKIGLKLYAHANCIVSPISSVLAPLHRKNPIIHANIVTFQSVSGAGKIASDDCINETHAILDRKKYDRSFFQKQIAFNIIPQIGEIDDLGNSSEENKIRKEIQKIVDNTILINATAVRVPVLQGHSSSLYLRFKHKISIFELKNILENANSLILNKNMNIGYSTPVEITGKDEIFIGRVRSDVSYPLTCYNLWICADNLRRGAATDSVEIVKKIIEFF